VESKGDLAWWKTETDPLLDDWNDTSVEATSLIVQGLVARDPKNPVLERAVRWLILNRNYGTYWSSTKQTAMVLYGLLDYMRARGETSADSAVDVFVNDRPAGSRTFTAGDLGASDPFVLSVPARAGKNTIRIVKRGAGALYWSASVEYFDKATRLERSGSRKLALVRAYYALSPVTARDGRIVYRETPLVDPVRPGDVLLVRLTAAGSTDWRYLMLEDPLPAGAEPIQQSEGYELENRERARWFGWFGERREFRDDRVVFFQDSFREGRYDFTYLLKVVTPGSFRAMPAQIAPMYIPEAHASSDAQALVVTGPGSPGAPRPR
jgi:hypothetical protein